jgi:hypothetical protein
MLAAAIYLHFQRAATETCQRGYRVADEGAGVPGVAPGAGYGFLMTQSIRSSSF